MVLTVRDRHHEQFGDGSRVEAAGNKQPEAAAVAAPFGRDALQARLDGAVVGDQHNARHAGQTAHPRAARLLSGQRSQVLSSI